MEKEFATGWYQVWAGFSSVLAFLIVFRNNQAYSRFWEGATLIQQIRGEWFNAVSSLISFMASREGPSATPEQLQRMDDFQHLLIRLMSLMYGAALHQVTDDKDAAVEIIDTDGVSRDHLEYLASTNDPCEVIMQWIQRLIVNANKDHILDVPPPILSRCFQELSRGIVNLNNVRKIKEIPFPFPYAQMIQVFLLVHWLTTPVLAALSIDSKWAAALVTFIVESGYWSLTYIAAEIDQPFGTDSNDLEMEEMQQDFNRSLFTLLDSLVQTPPAYDRRAATNAKSKSTRLWARANSQEIALPRESVALARAYSSSFVDNDGNVVVLGVNAETSKGHTEEKTGPPWTTERLSRKNKRSIKIAAPPDAFPPPLQTASELGAEDAASTLEVLKVSSCGTSKSSNDKASKEMHRLKSDSENKVAENEVVEEVRLEYDLGASEVDPENAYLRSASNSTEQKSQAALRPPMCSSPGLQKSQAWTQESLS